MTTEKIKPNNNWFKCGDTNSTSIQAYKRYLDENNKPVKNGNFDINMRWTIFESWAELLIDVFDQDNNSSNQINIKCTLDQVINIKPTKLAFYIKEKDKKKYDYAVNMGRFHFYNDKKDKLWDEGEIKKFKKDIDDKQIDLEDLIKEKKGV